MSNTFTPTLRLKQTASIGDKHHVELEWLNGDAPQKATATITLSITEQDQQDIRWYVEDYAENPFEPYPTRAKRIEERMRALGIELFNGLFGANTRMLRLWATIADQLKDVRVQIETDAKGATAIPWELLRDTDTVLSLHAKSFVRVAPETLRRPLRLEQQHVIRILLVICRPSGRADVPFRSVASRLIKGLSAEARQVFQLDVLRPPTFAQLARTLSEAKARGEPYHVVHFDGHGMYGKADDLPKDVPQRQFRASGPQGYLLFETDDSADTRKLVSGGELGNLLVQHDVPLLVLNACRSAHAEQADDEAANSVTAAVQEEESEAIKNVRAFGSLAQQVMLQGVGGVVAMRYSVYVVTAAQFVAELYRALVQGRPLGEAVTRGRQHLHEQPVREVVPKLTLQDWLVPVVYESQSMQVFTPPRSDLGVTFSIKSADATPKRGDLDETLPTEPDAGFFGRDETLLALDRAFDKQHVVLLHAFAGSGKTTTAAEFARWYALTGGVNGPVLFTSFEQRKPLMQVLDQLGHLFDSLLQQNGIHWDALTDLAQKRDLALQIMQQVPVLWIWDNVEPVAGFPHGTPSAWSADEQRELVDFLRAARNTKAKFLLTSRRDERGWLDDLPAPVAMPPMPLPERRQLAEALADKHGLTLDQAAWRPLLLYTGGNPLTLTVVVGQALRDGLRTEKQIRDYVQRLRSGEAAFEDDQSEHRSKSLRASLEYGFKNTFSDDERKILALLHHFQGFVDVDALKFMGDASQEWHVPAAAGMTRDAGIALLDRAAEVGLLAAYGGGYYSIHPALPWFFRQLYDEYYPDDVPARAYVEAISELGNYHHYQYIQHGNSSAVGALRAEEANLLHALQMARQHEWYLRVIGPMQGLQMLYDHTGRRAEWRQLVAEATPLFVDDNTGGPLAGREQQWVFVNEYRVRLLQKDKQSPEAARLQELLVKYNREQATALLALPVEQLDRNQRNTLRSLAVSIEALGHLQREQNDPACVASYDESYQLKLKFGDQVDVSATAYALGRAYQDILALRDLDQAEQWYQRSLEMRAEGDDLYKATSIGQLGSVAYERFLDARQANQLNEVLYQHWKAALRAYKEALAMLPQDEVDARAAIHNALGNIYAQALPDYLEQCVSHHREAIRYREQAGDLYYAAHARHNVALTYAKVGRFEDALLFAQVALRNFEQFGPAAADLVERTRRLIANIEQMARAGR